MIGFRLRMSCAGLPRRTVIVWANFRFTRSGGDDLEYQIDEFLKEVAADFEQHGFDDQFLARSI